MRGPSVLSLVAVLLAGCTGAQAGNLLSDPSFEASGAGWFFPEDSPNWAGFTVEPGPARSGERSLVTDLSSRTGSAVLIAGAVQEIDARVAGRRLPEHIAVDFYAENWTALTEKAYLQVVVSVFPIPDESRPLCGTITPPTPCQVAYLIGGIDRAPLPLANRRYILVDSDVPALGTWKHFERPFRADYLNDWGSLPLRWDHLWIYLEARYEEPPGTTDPRPVDIRVRWDDAYFGNARPGA